MRAGDEVIVPAYSFVATPLSVAQVGAVPVFVDVDEATGCIDVAAAEAAVTERTRGIMPVHMHGGAADLDGLLALAKKRGLILVEDAAQAHGATCSGKPVEGARSARAAGSRSRSSKNLAGSGEGGLMVTNDADVAVRSANSVRNFRSRTSLYPTRGGVRPYPPARRHQGSRSRCRMGSMFRGNEMMAAFTPRAQLARLPERTEESAVATPRRLAAALDDLPGDHPPSEPAGRTSVHHKFRVQLDPARADVPLSALALRGAMLRALRAEGVEVGLWQSTPLPAQGVFQQRDERGGYPRQLPGGTDLAANYDPARYPRTRALSFRGSVRALLAFVPPHRADHAEIVEPLRRCLPEGLAAARAARRRGTAVKGDALRGAGRAALACAGLALASPTSSGGRARVASPRLPGARAGPWLPVIVVTRDGAAHDRARHRHFAICSPRTRRRCPSRRGPGPRRSPTR